MSVVFLDRDGVINKYPGYGNYVTKVKDFHFINGSLEAVRLLTQRGFEIFIVTNQAGVGKGIYSLKKLEMITARMLREIEKSGGKISRVFNCTHRSDQNCNCRKPRTGSLKKAFEIVKAKRKKPIKAYFVGDTEIDMTTGHQAGCTTIFVLSGKENRRTIKTWKVRPDHIAKNLLEATAIIAHENSRHPRLSRRRPHQGC